MCGCKSLSLSDETLSAKIIVAHDWSTLCELLVFVLKMDVFNARFNLRTIYQVGGLQQVLVTNYYCHLLTMMNLFVA